MDDTSPLKFSYLEVPRKLPYIERTIGQQLHVAVELYGDKEMYVFYADNKRMTFKDVQQESLNLAASFTARGITKGDVLLMVGDMHSESLVTFFACAYIGVIVGFNDNGWMVKAVMDIVSKTRQKQKYYSSLDHKGIFMMQLSIKPKTKDLMSNTYIFVGGPAEGSNPGGNNLVMISYEETRCGQVEKINMELVIQINDAMRVDDPLAMYFTSGSSGTPKAALFSHRKLDEVTECFSYRYGVKGYLQTWNMKCLLSSEGVSAGSSFNAMVLPIVRGCTTVIPFASYDAELLAQSIHYERCTETIMYMHQMSDLMNLTNRDKYDFSSMQIVVPTGSFIPLSLRRQAETSGLTIMTLMTYGSTEFGGVFMQHPLDSQNRLKAPAYYPTGGVKVKLIDNHGNVVPIQTKGEVCVSSFSIFMCYFGDGEATEIVKDENEWYFTGDIGKMDEEGFIQILGRKSDFIIMKADRISPKDLEGVLYQHPDVHDAVVVGVPDEINCEAVCACVVPRCSTNKPSQEKMVEFCGDRVAHRYSVPKYLLYFDAFPTTHSGKFHRRQIQAQADERLKLPTSATPMS